MADVEGKCPGCPTTGAGACCQCGPECKCTPGQKDASCACVDCKCCASDAPVPKCGNPNCKCGDDCKCPPGECKC